MARGRRRVDRGTGGGPAAAVERMDDTLVGLVDEPERVAPQATGMSRDDGERGVGRDRGIHRAAASAQDAQTGGRCEVVGADHGPVGAPGDGRGDERRCPVGGMGHRASG